MIEGRLVNLRAQEMTDAERMHRWVNDREVTRHLNTRYPWSLAAEEAFLRQRTGAPPAFNDLSFAIETKDGTHIGSCGLHEVSPEDRQATLGIMIGEKQYWSKGYGSDAVETLLRFAFEEMDLHRIELTVFSWNQRAIASYRKCGFVEEVRRRQARYSGGEYTDILVMGVFREEWQAGQGAAPELRAVEAAP